MMDEIPNAVVPNAGIDPSVCHPDARETIEAFIGTKSPSVEQIWAAMDFVGRTWT